MVTSVLPTPVGPENKKLPTGLFSAPRPARDNLIALARVEIAVSWPNTTRFRLVSKFDNCSLSVADTLLAGIRAILATTVSTSLTPILVTRLSSGNSC